MEQFIVSARKYRPDTFESLIGQENIARTLKNSIIRGQLAHAYLFCGPRGVGKTTTARIFAKSINCLNPGPDMEPCGKCESCLSFAEGRSYCIHELDAASNNSVDDIRNLTDMVRIPPQVGKYSVYIIDEVHMLSSAAFNAFLKTSRSRPPTPSSSWPPLRSIRSFRPSSPAVRPSTSTASASPTSCATSRTSPPRRASP